MENICDCNNIKNLLISTYKYRIELHSHTTPVSGCSAVTPKEMADTYNQRGYDAIVITNHFTSHNFRDMSKQEAIKFYLSGYEETKTAAKNCNLKVLLGAEIRFDENANDYLLYGVDEQILSVCYDYFDKGVESFRKEVNLPNSVFVQAHPFRDNMVRVSPELLDGMETFNMHPEHNSRVGVAVRYASENGIKIKIAGSDYHKKATKGDAVTALRTKILPNDSFELAGILKSNDYIYEIGGSSIVIM